jgi:hypothetical protein
MSCNGSQVKNMDNRVSVERYRPMSSLSLASRSLRVIALAAALALTACGGGGGGGDDGGNPPPPDTGEIAATVVDQFDAPINGVTITAGSRTATTGSAGTATVTQVPTGSVSVTASADGLADPPAQTVTVTDGGTATVEFIMQRVVEAAGGITKAEAVGPPNAEGSRITLRIGVIVFDESFTPVSELDDSAFTLPNCAPVDENPPRADCVRGIDSPGFDAPYTVVNVNGIPSNFSSVAATGPVSYAAGLLFDSSESMADSDPTDARIFATKEYLNDIGTDDSVMLAAFADQEQRELPNEGVNYFPCDPCTPSFTNDGNSLFASLDSLATLEGGGTPLYDSLEEMVITVDSEAPPAATNQAAVLFSDGRDIYCDDPDPPEPKPPGNFAFCIQRRGEVAEEADGRGVDLFTIGLASENVDSVALAELALRNGGAFLFAERPTQLISIFGILDRLLADEVPSYEMEWTVDAAAGTFLSGRAVVGKLTVGTGSTTVTLPFAVQIP